MPAKQLYEITIEATAEVRDADGNLLSSSPAESTVQVTAEQATEIQATLDRKASS